MKFEKYQHLEKLGNTEVSGIEYGICYIFPKLDGTNASLWSLGGEVQAGSRNRHLSLEKDNAGFLECSLSDENIKNFFSDHPGIRLCGEWLVPHTIKTYMESAWRKFYVFDVKDGDKYLEYEEYKEMLDEHEIEYITPICKISNPTDERLYDLLEKNTYLIKDNEGVGEGIVIKNYAFKNTFGNTVWAKIVRNEFKAKAQKVFNVNKIKEKNIIEAEIVERYVTAALVEKEYCKIVNDSGWSSKSIPRLLSVVYYCLIKEESWNFLKEFKDPLINFKRLRALTIIKTKEYKPELF